MARAKLPSDYKVRRIPAWPEIQEIRTETQVRAESQGTREKYWISLDCEPNLWLLKFPRTDTGEHWAEKVTYEVGRLIGVNCARVELAEYDGELVTICESFDPDNWYELYDYVHDEPDSIDDDIPIDVSNVRFVDRTDFDDEDVYFVVGCEVLALHIPDYDVSREARFNQTQHNVSNIIDAVKKFAIGIGATQQRVEATLQGLASYAILDGLVGNVDRHHENWMLQFGYRAGCRHVAAAPSYDHASSLGRELKDERRQRILDSNGVSRYLKPGSGGKRGRGGVFDVETNPAPSPLELAVLLGNRWPDYTRCALNQVNALDNSALRTIIQRVPDEFMSDVAREFAFEVMVTAKNELLKALR